MHVVFQAITEHLFSMLSQEAVILSLKNGKYYGLNPVGVSIWRASKEPVTLAEIETAINARIPKSITTPVNRQWLSFLEKNDL